MATNAATPTSKRGSRPRLRTQKPHERSTQPRHPVRRRNRLSPAAAAETEADQNHLLYETAAQAFASSLEGTRVCSTCLRGGPSRVQSLNSLPWRKSKRASASVIAKYENSQFSRGCIGISPNLETQKPNEKSRRWKQRTSERKARRTADLLSRSVGTYMAEGKPTAAMRRLATPSADHRLGKRILDSGSCFDLVNKCDLSKGRNSALRMEKFIV